MEVGDIPRVVELERASFGSPWNAGTFARILESEHVEIWVVEEPDAPTLIAYAVLWCVSDQGELANIAVAPEARGRGLGGRLLDWILQVALGRGVETLYLEVRESNAAARGLYESRGFREAGRRRGYYDNPREDAMVLVLDLAGAPESR